MVALDSGLVENIRLYGNYEASFYTKEDAIKDSRFAEGTRKYVGDTSNDPLWNIVNILFPSNNGQLGVQTESDRNIGRYVSDPGAVAFLVNFAKAMYDDKEVDIDKTIDTIANILKDADGKPLAGKIKQNIKKEIKGLLTYIGSAIQREKKNESLYPKGTTVQMIQAFFCYKFTTKDDIAKELDALDDSICDHKKLGTSILEEKDIKDIIKKEKLDVDDLFDLTQGYIFTCLVPFSYGLCYDELKETNLWQTYCTLMPRQRLVSEKKYRNLWRAPLS